MIAEKAGAAWLLPDGPFRRTREAAISIGRLSVAAAAREHSRRDAAKDDTGTAKHVAQATLLPFHGELHRRHALWKWIDRLPEDAPALAGADALEVALARAQRGLHRLAACVLGGSAGGRVWFL